MDDLKTTCVQEVRVSRQMTRSRADGAAMIDAPAMARKRDCGSLPGIEAFDLILIA